MKKFTHLHVPETWKHYWTKYPEGYTILESLLSWVSQVDSMVTNINDWNEYLYEFVEKYDKRLQTVVVAILNEMLDNGDLADVINNEVFNMKANQEDLEELDSRITSQLNETETHINSIEINVKYPPYPLEGVKDDNKENAQPKLQAMLDYLNAQGGGTLFFPKGTYLIENINAEYGLKVYRRIKLKGAGMSNTTIRANSNMNALIGSDIECDYFETENIQIDANNQANHALSLFKKYSPYLSIVNTLFNKAKEDAVKLATYMSAFTKSITQLSKNGWTIWGLTGIEVNTSLTFNSCYANNMAEKGFNIRAITYSSFNSCAADDCSNSYYFYDAKGVTLNGSGCERSKQPLNVFSAEGMTINGFYMLGSGSITSPPDYLMEFRKPLGVTIAGLKLDMFGTNRSYFKHVLGVTAVGTGQENITVTDNSIKKADVSYPLNSEFSKMNAINFLADNDQLSFYAIKEVKTVKQWYKITKLKYNRSNSDRAYFMGWAMTSGNYGNSKKRTSKVEFSFAIGDGTSITPLYLNYGNGIQASGLWAQIHKTSNGEFILFMQIPEFTLSTIFQFDSQYCFHLFEEYNGDFSEYTKVWDSYSDNVQDVFSGRNRIQTTRTGTTASRPTSNINDGFQYFDVTLGKPIFRHGSVWKDATGATV